MCNQIDSLITSVKQHRFKLLAALLFLLSSSQAFANSLKDINFNALPGERVEIQLSMTDTAALPNTFTIDQPARIALDFPNTNVALGKKIHAINIGIARSLTAIEAGGRTRVVINLTKLVEYNTVVEGNNVFITIGGSGTKKHGSFNKPVLSKRGIIENITDIDFRRGTKGEGRVVIKLTDPNTPVDIVKRGTKVLVTIKNNKLATKLERRLDVIDFATPVQTVDAFNQGTDTKIIITSAGKYEHLAYQTNNLLTIDVKKEIKLSEDEAKKKRKNYVYSGERLSLNFQNIEVRAVLQLIADFTGINMVTSDTVDGELTLRLKNVPWDQALDIILKTKGLDKRQNGNVMLIAPAEEMAQRDKIELEARKSIQELAPIISQTVQVNYSNAIDFVKLIYGRTAGVGGGSGGSSSSSRKSGYLSPRGRVSFDKRSNKLIVFDIQEKVDGILAMVKELDIPNRQVLIESRIVIAGTTFGKELGVRFGFNRSTSANTGQANQADIGISNTVVNADDVRQGNQPTAANRLNVNLPSPSAFGTVALALARLPFGTLLDLELSAAQAEGRSETVSAPRLITGNNNKAYIKQGFEIPYQSAAASGATSIEFKEATLKLEVTPQITPDDNIIMELLVKKDRPDFSQAGPPIQKREVKTRVRVRNGETIVLGGIYEHTSTDNVAKVPFFGDLPLIGVLFRSHQESNDKSELLIFVTPKIISDNLTL
ncbi:Type IV pilus biogenesis protein PilQ [hydrothermal vent metagenome]|uniref:Type IV pilus biogenesis protein PilQ n=1 Tax=hydrothermal vent metagenome TaxID=652676 RepID=A0A3B0ZNY8_9ZZZZ